MQTEGDTQALIAVRAAIEHVRGGRLFEAMCTLAPLQHMADVKEEIVIIGKVKVVSDSRGLEKRDIDDLLMRLKILLRRSGG